MNKIRVCSLFSGIGGFETGIFNAIGKENVEIVFSSEIDKYADKAYETLYGHKTMGDITKINEKDVPDHDVLVGGFPCQAFSIAGKRKGFNDARGTMFFEIARIVHEKQPKVLLLENVKGLINHNQGQTLETMLEILSDEGYTVDFNVLNSKHFNVPQNRERIVIVGIRNKLAEEWIIQGNDVVAKAKKKLMNNKNIKAFNFKYPENNKVNKTIRDILETNVDEKYYLSEDKTAKLIEQLGNNGEPTINKHIKRVGIAEIDGHDFNKRIYSVEGISRTLNTASDIGRSVKIAEPADIKPKKIGGLYGAKQAGSMWDVNKISPTLKTSSGGYSEPIIIEPNLEMGGGHREPKIFVQDHGEIREKTDGISTCIDANYWKGLDNHGARTGVIEEDREALIYQQGRGFNDGGLHDIAPSLTSHSYEHNNHLVHGWHIRKLTPLECFRLQGFPDEYYHKLKDAGISDSQLYKMAGNAVTTNVIEAVFKNIVKLL